MFSTVSLFVENSLVSSGPPRKIGLEAREQIEQGGSSGVLLFDDTNGRQLDVDLRDGKIHGLESSQQNPPENRRRGRPKLGVVSREVTLLPNHWQWLSQQPGGASAALRRLVSSAKENNSDQDKVRQSQNAAYTFMNAIAGNLPGFEEVNRALFAGNQSDFVVLIEPWPGDIAQYAMKLASCAFAD